MPLDSHQYLVKQGWGGKGTALRHGALVRPIAIPQKRTLAGVGKDRDEAFPFWDHLFTLSAKTIQIKVHEDSDKDSSCSDTDENAQSATALFARTKTGILSNRRPIASTPASTSGTSTPSTITSSDSTSDSRLSLLSLAKREAAKRSLYIRFYRGSVLRPEIPPSHENQPCNVAGPSSIASTLSVTATVSVSESNGSGRNKRKEKKERARSKERIAANDDAREEATSSSKEKSMKSGKDKSKKRKYDDFPSLELSEASPDELRKTRKKMKQKNIDERGIKPSPDPESFSHNSGSLNVPATSPEQTDAKATQKASDNKEARKAEKRKRKEEKATRRAEREVRRQRRRERKGEKEGKS